MPRGERLTMHKRLRDLGISPGTLPPGPLNAITDVAGVKVGYSTLIRDEPHVVRTGVTAIWPRAEGIWTNAVFGGAFSFNGYGEMTGLAWLAEQGLIAAPICITNTFSVGVVRDAVCAVGLRDNPSQWPKVSLDVPLPIVAETYDGLLNDIEHFSVTPEHVFEALENASSGALAEGNVGGGTGMLCHEFKGGTGTSSRIAGGYTVGALVQSNYGRRESLRIAGVPVGQIIGVDKVPSGFREAAGTGSIIIVLATDAPLLPIQCQRLARRATTGLAWAGGYGGSGSGDIFLAFATGNDVRTEEPVRNVRMLAPTLMTDLFLAAAEATEEAILNSMIAAETMTGYRDRVAYALPHDLLREAMRTSHSQLA